MNFSVILLALTVVTGVLWCLDKFVWAPKRLALAKERAQKFQEDNRDAIDRGVISVIGEGQSLFNRTAKQPLWLEYSAGLFPVILAVFIFRSFIIEPFRIPSGSMLPTLHVGDFIAVNKYEYGLRFPVFNFEITRGEDPKRGDIIVFKYPLDKNELKDFSAIVFDPPRAGASAQCKEIASAPVKPEIIVAVSCNPATFVNDAKMLISGGYNLKEVTMVDQFIYSDHSELVAFFTK